MKRKLAISAKPFLSYKKEIGQKVLKSRTKTPLVLKIAMLPSCFAVFRNGFAKVRSRSVGSHIAGLVWPKFLPGRLATGLDRFRSCTSCASPARNLASTSVSPIFPRTANFIRRMSSPSGEANPSSLTEVREVANDGAGPGDRAMGWWLLGCCGLVLGMVSLGGVTRLTGTGLSMVKWRPHGEYPPITQAEWEAEFEEFKQFPEYQMKRKYENFTLDEFKFIYFMEWSHRMAGRALGVAFAVPLLYFAARVCRRPNINKILNYFLNKQKT